MTISMYSASIPALRRGLTSLAAILAKAEEHARTRKIDGSEERDVSLQAGGKTHEFKGLPYLTDWVLPNFYFHVTTAYAILRHNGVELAKKDFLG